MLVVLGNEAEVRQVVLRIESSSLTLLDTPQLLEQCVDLAPVRRGGRPKFLFFRLCYCSCRTAKVKKADVNRS